MIYYHIKKTRKNLIATLLRFGTDPKVRDEEGNVAVDHAIKNEYLKNSESLQKLKITVHRGRNVDFYRVFESIIFDENALQNLKNA